MRPNLIKLSRWRSVMSSRRAASRFLPSVRFAHAVAAICTILLCPFGGRILQNIFASAGFTSCL